MKIVKIYDYKDESNVLLYQVVRYEPKTFRQRRPDGDNWIWNLTDVRRVLYRFQELLNADPAEPVFIVEGEKDVDKLYSIGLVATTCAGGASSWIDNYSDFLNDRVVCVIPDNDEPGRNHAKTITKSVIKAGGKAKVIILPDLPPKGDVSDWLDSLNGSKAGLLELVDQTKTVKLSQAITLESDLPDIVATVFEKQSKVEHRYNRYDGWSIWHNGKYQKVEDTKEIRLHIRKFLSKCKVKKKKKEGDKWTEYTEKLKKQSSGFVSDVLECLASINEVHVLPAKKAPCSLDGALDAQYIIAANNVLIDISKRPHACHAITKQFYTMNYLTYDYKEDAFGDKWANFLVDITIGDLDLMVLLQQWCGYLLLPTLKYQKFLLCVGDGANGKGVFFDTITAALGAKNVSNVPLSRFEDTSALFGTYGKLANMSNESAKTLSGDAESVLKEYVAGDKILWRQLYKDAFFDYPTAKLMFATNELPKIHDASDGIWRRMILVPFDAKFTGDNINSNLTRELQQPKELAGILNWMIEGAEMLIKNNGFIQPKRVEKALETYRNESNSARLFLIEQVEKDTIENELRLPCTWLHQQYQIWCKSNGFKPLNNVNFGKIIWTQYNVKKSRPWFGDKKLTIYLGIKPQDGVELDIALAKWTYSGYSESGDIAQY